MLGLVASFWLAHAAALGLLAARGHCITARWHIGPVCNGYFWTVLVTSPEVAVFMFFMITDPKTAPRGRIARNVYGAAIALVFVALAASQRTEYATKVALLGALALVCAARPLLERISTRPPTRESPGERSGVDAPALRRSGAAPPAPRRADHRPRRRVRRDRRRRRNICELVGCRHRRGGGARELRRPRRPSASPNATNRRSRRAAGTDSQNAINVSTRISSRAAKGIVIDVIDDLAIADEAIEHRTPELAGDVAGFPWINELITTICATTATVVVSSYQITSDRERHETDHRPSIPRDRCRTRRRQTAKRRSPDRRLLASSPSTPTGIATRSSSPRPMGTG